MSLSLSQAVTGVRSMLNEATSVFWSDTEIQTWIQEGCIDFSSKSLMVEDDDDITLVANQIIYDSSDAAFISTVLEPYAALYNDGSNNWKGLIKIQPRMIGNEATNKAGPSKNYALHNKKIYIWPAPTAAMVSAGATIRILYAKLTNDITVLTDEYQHIPMLYAKAMCLYKDRRFNDGNDMMALYSSFAGFERNDKHNRETDSLDMFKVRPRGGQNGAA